MLWHHYFPPTTALVWPSIRVFQFLSVTPGFPLHQNNTVSLQWLDIQFSSLQHSVMTDTLWPHGLHNARLPCPSPTPRHQAHVHCVSDAIPFHFLSIPFYSCLQSFQASRSFQMSQFFTSGGQSVKVFTFGISPFNEYSGLISYRMDWLDLLAVQGTLKSLLQHHSSKASILQHSPFFMVQLTSIHDHRKNHSFD